MQVREGAREQVEGTCGKGSRATRTRERTPRAAATPADANARKEYGGEDTPPWLPGCVLS